VAVVLEGATYHVGSGIPASPAVRGSPVSDSTWNLIIGIGGLLINGVGLEFVAIQVGLARRQAIGHAA
jgi:hypothetical protein